MLPSVTLVVIGLGFVTWEPPQSLSANIEPQVDEIFAPWSAPGSPGVAVGVYRAGQVVLAKGYGLAHLEHDVPITAGTVFYLASVSKQFVAAAALLLVQDGKLTLDDDVRDYVPELPDYGQPITVRHLIHHTSGLRDYVVLATLAGRTVDQYHDDREIIAMLARQRALNFEPGTQHAYSNSGYFLLNVIIERVSGRSLRAFADERIFKPLGMTKTHFHDDFKHIIRHRAMGYFPSLGDSFTQFITTFDRVGSGGVYSNVNDLFRWERNFHDRTVGGDALYLAQHERGRLSNGDVLDYAAGLTFGHHRGLKIVEHGGALGGYRSIYLRFPQQRLAVVVLANLSSVDPDQLARRVADLYLADTSGHEVPPKPEAQGPALIELSEAELAPLEGYYWNRSAGLMREVRLRGGKLYYVRSFSSRSELGPTETSAFVMVGVGVHVPVVFSNGTMTVTAPGEGTLVYERYEPHEVTEGELAELAGRYHSTELGTSFELAAENGVLVLRMRSSRVPLLPVIRDVFTLPRAGIVVAVQRDDTGAASGFRLDVGGVRGLELQRAAE